MKFFTKFRRDEKGATAIEYGLIAALIAVAAIGALQGVGQKLRGTFETVDNKLDTATATPPAGNGG